MPTRNRLAVNSAKKLNKPAWLKIKAGFFSDYLETKSKVTSNKLHTVCEEAACPNIGECWKMKHATVMILGDTCTRSCKFCNVKTGKPLPVDVDEPKRVANLALELGLKHMVITSVDRDDLDDGGALQFVKCIEEIRKLTPKTTIEVLTPDFIGKKNAFEMIVDVCPDVFNHNTETVPRLYGLIKPKAKYFHSLNLLWKVKKLNPQIFTKSGLIVGMGEDNREIIQVMDDLRSAEVDFLTIGQYLQPTGFHLDIDRYVTPDEFELFKRKAIRKGFSMVSSSPFTRSSYHADSDFEKLRDNVAKQLNKKVLSINV